MALKYTFSDLFKGKLPIPKKLYECLQQLQEQIDDKPSAKPVVAHNVKLGKRALKKEFGNPKEFRDVGIVFNAEGSYLIVSNGTYFYYCNLDEV